MAVKTLDELFVHALSDIHSAERQLVKALPKMAKAASNPKLKAAFEAHLGETEEQVERIDRVVGLLGIKLERIKCAAMEGLVEEGKEAIDEVDEGPVRDAALINAAQKVEHYEIASYGTLVALGRQLGHDAGALELLHDTLEEEKATDEKLSILAQGEANAAAAAVDPDADAAAKTTSGTQARKSSPAKSTAKAGGTASKTSTKSAAKQPAKKAAKKAAKASTK